MSEFDWDEIATKAGEDVGALIKQRYPTAIVSCRFDIMRQSIFRYLVEIPPAHYYEPDRSSQPVLGGSATLGYLTEVFTPRFLAGFDDRLRDLRLDEKLPPPPTLEEVQRAIALALDGDGSGIKALSRREAALRQIMTDHAPVIADKLLRYIDSHQQKSDRGQTASQQAL